MKTKILLLIASISYFFLQIVLSFNDMAITTNIDNHPKTSITVENFIKNTIKEEKIKKIFYILENKKKYLIKKYWVISWYIKYINILISLDKIVNKYIDNPKYKKYKMLLIKIHNYLVTYIDYIKNVKEYEIDITYINDNKRKRIINELLYWINYNNFYNKLSLETKQFLEYLNNIQKSTWNINVLEKYYNNNKKKYEKKNNDINIKFPKIDYDALKKDIDTIERNWWTISEKEYNIIEKQTNMAINNLGRIKRDILSKLKWKVIILTNLKPKWIQFWYQIFWNNKMKMAINTIWNNCFIEKWFFLKNNIANVSKSLSYIYNNLDNKTLFVSFYNNEIKVYNLKDSCFNNNNAINNSFSFMIDNNNIDIKKKILWKLWAEYIENQYKNLILVWNNVYYINKDIFDWENDKDITDDYTLINNVSLTKTFFANWKKKPNIYFNPKYIPKYNKTIFWYHHWFFRNWFWKVYINKENFIYLWNIKLLKNNLYYFYNYFSSLLDWNFLIWKVSKDYYFTDVDNIYPKFAKEYNEKIANILKNLKIMIYKNRFEDIKSLYKYIETKYTYDLWLVNRSDELYKEWKYKESSLWYDLNYLIKNKKWVCFHYAILWSLISSMYWLPAWHIWLLKKNDSPWHAVSLIFWNIYDFTSEVWKNNIQYDWIWKTFVENDNSYWELEIYYPKNTIKYINKTSPIFKLKINYSWY